MVKIPAVVDSACLIGLEWIDRLDLLPALLEPVMAPPAVESEFGPLPPWILVQVPSDVGMVAALRLVVDAGESEAIALAYETRTRIILDDRRAREAAQRLGVPVTGTVGLALEGEAMGGDSGNSPSSRRSRLESVQNWKGASFRGPALGGRGIAAVM